MGIFDFIKRKNDGHGQSEKQGESFSFTLNGKTTTISLENAKIAQQALSAYENKDYKTALELYSKLIVLEPTAHQYYQFRGTVYEDMRNDPMAQKDFEKSIELNPENSTSLYRIAMVYHRKSDIDKAIEYLRKAYAVTTKNDDKLGVEFGYKDIMGKSYNNILMVHRRLIVYNLANFLIQKNQINEGMPLLDELIKYCPTYAYPYYSKALYYCQNNRAEEALPYAQKAAQYGHPKAQSLIMFIKQMKSQTTTMEDRYTKMIKNASINPFNITCDPNLQNQQNLPNLTSVFEQELNNLYSKLESMGNVPKEMLVQMASGYAFNLVESYYNNAGYVPKNSLDQILEQVYKAMQQTGFRTAFGSFDDFKYNCYYGYLNN